MNPENGICLSPLYDRAFDKGYIGINENYEVMLSTVLKKKEDETFHQQYFAPIAGFKTDIPKRYAPKKEFLQFHNDIIFRK